MIQGLFRAMPQPTATKAAASVTAAALGLASFSASATTQNAGGDDTKVALNPNEWREFKVQKVENVTHDTKRVVFALPTPDTEMGVTTASCLLAKAQINGKNVIRPYTPVNLNDEKGYLELVVKGYPQGNLSKHITDLKEGDTLELKGPLQKFEYKRNMYKKLGLIAGGSGLTPMLQLVKTACRDPQDNTEITLIYANKTENDIIIKDELDALEYMYPQLKVHHVLDNPSESWEGHKGYVSKDLIKELLPAPSDDNLICVCGPPPMMNAISGDKAKDKSQGELTGALKELGYSQNGVFKY